MQHHIKLILFLLGFLFIIAFASVASAQAENVHFKFNGDLINAGNTSTNAINNTNATGITAFRNGKISQSPEIWTGLGGQPTGSINITSNSFLNFAGAFSIAFWINNTGGGANQVLLEKGITNATQNLPIWSILADFNGDRYSFTNTGNSFNFVTGMVMSSGNNADGRWHHVVVTRNNSLTVNMCVDGICNSTGNVIDTTDYTNFHNISIGYRQNNIKINGSIDDLRIWKGYALTQADVNTIYNAGAGTEASLSASPVQVTLTNPADNSFLSGNVTFNATGSLSIAYYNWTNTTLFIWRNNGTLFRNFTNTVAGSSTNMSNWSVSNFVPGTFLWNTQWCGQGFNCTFALNNFSFQWRPFEVINVSFNSTVYETSLQRFIINIQTIQNILSVSGALHYNGTSYPATSVCVGENCTLTRDIDIPLVSQALNSENKTFNWIINVFDGTNQISFNNSIRNHTVERIYLASCAGSTVNRTVNFTTYDEQSRARIQPFRLGATFNFWLGTGTTFRNSSFDDVSVVERPICITPSNLTFKTNAQIEYRAAGSLNNSYNQRTYYFQNASMTNETQHIRLFLLNSSSSTSFIQRVITSSQIPVEGALISTQRYYPENDTYETVSITKTDNNGESVGFYEVEIPDYRHFITQNGQLLKVTERGKVFPESAPFTLIFTIGGSFDSPWEAFQGISNLYSNMTFNRTTGIVSYTWIDATGTLSIANLTVERMRGNQSNSVFCTTTSTLQAGTLSCNLSGQDGSFIAKGYVGRSPAVLDKLITIVMNEIREVLARPFLFLWILLLITAIGVGMYFPPAGIAFLIMTMVGGVLLGVVAVSWIFVWAIVAVGIWILIEASR